MRKLFGYDGILTRASEVVTVFILSNLLTLICSLPIITIGGALAGHHKVMQDYVMQNSRAVLKTYFTAFWQNLGRSTILLLLFLVTVVFLAADFYFVMMFTSGIFALILYIVLLIVLCLVVGITACCLSLIVRYENTLAEHLRNCLYLMISHLGRFIGLAAVAAFPVVMFLVYPATFVEIIPAWVFFGISLLVYIHTILVKPLFDSMEGKPTTEERSLA